MTRRSALLATLAGCTFPLVLAAADWPQWRGPNRDDVSKETGLLKEWPENGPKLLWTFTNAGVGYSGPAIVGDRLYTMGAREGMEYVLALDVKTGTEKWSAKVGPMFNWKGNTWNAGPSATPAVDGELLYALGGQGELVCLEAATGRERWRKNLPKDLGGEVNPIGGAPEEQKLGWGYAWSPLVDGDRLVCVPGGKQGMLAALDKKTGAVVWQSKELTDQATYSSPIVAEVGGVRQYVQMTNQGVAGVAAADGKLLWYYKREDGLKDVVIATPIFRDNHVYFTAGYGIGCDLVRLTPGGKETKAEEAYSNTDMQSRDGGVVLVGDHIYGYSEKKGWACQEWETGKIVWSDKRKLARGSVTCADGRLYCYSEEGVVALVEASPAKPGWNEKGRFEIPQRSKLNKPSGKTWTHPVVCDGRLYLRDQDLIFCYEVK